MGVTREAYCDSCGLGRHIFHACHGAGLRRRDQTEDHPGIDRLLSRQLPVPVQHGSSRTQLRETKRLQSTGRLFSEVLPRRCIGRGRARVSRKPLTFVSYAVSKRLLSQARLAAHALSKAGLAGLPALYRKARSLGERVARRNPFVGLLSRWPDLLYVKRARSGHCVGVDQWPKSQRFTRSFPALVFTTTIIHVPRVIISSLTTALLAPAIFLGAITATG